MKTNIISALVISMALLSCTNQSSSGKDVKQEVKQEVIADSVSSQFRIVAQQDSVTKDGESIERYKNGVIRIRGMMKDGKREGLWKSWYEDGKPWSETTFSGGIKNGRTTTWFENGNKRYEGEYTNDKESGKWIYYDESGKELVKKDYDKK